MYQTFRQAFAFSNPDVVVYLGDLLDEGNIANSIMYNSYVSRFYNIFVTPDVKTIHIPGDNDIGGENGEYITNANLRRFDIEFMKNDVFDYKDRIRFFKINRMIFDISNPQRDTNYNKIRIGLSHMPILQPGGPLQRNIMNEIDPHIIFTAHWHDSRIFIYPSTKSMLFEENDIKEFDIKTFKDENTYLEIMIPTSSYRMGKSKMGFGLALIEENTLSKQVCLKFSILWSPERFYYLKIYAIWITIMLTYFVLKYFVSNAKEKKTSALINKRFRSLNYNRI